ncbi:MAG: substrate-binding domain-containing protein [Phycisphaeraceae bacterium]|nr:substrate-binding domain-containing protein [Phycisphaeraceae bacterium]
MRDRLIGIALDLEYPYPHHQDVFAGVMAYARQRPGWRCVIDEHPGAKPKQRVLARPEYSGVIARADPKLQRLVKRLSVPMVNVQYEHHKKGFATVRVDVRLSGRLAAEHFLSRGYRRFGMLTSGQGRNRLDIADAFVRRLQEEEMSCDARLFPEDDAQDVGHWVRLENFLQDWIRGMKTPIALFIESTITARLLVEMCHEIGLDVPQDIAVLCFENNRAMTEVGTQLSAIDEDYKRMGYEAAELLDRLMDGAAAPDDPVLIPSPGIVARESTDYFAVDDALVAQALRFISRHLAEKLSVDSIAYELAVSPRTLQNRFDAALGHGVGAEVRRLRLAAAKIMLAEPELAIGKIASRVGFSGSAVMSQVFRREVGVSPGAFRKQRLAED